MSDTNDQPSGKRLRAENVIASQSVASSKSNSASKSFQTGRNSLTGDLPLDAVFTDSTLKTVLRLSLEENYDFNKPDESNSYCADSQSIHEYNASSKKDLEFANTEHSFNVPQLSSFLDDPEVAGYKLIFGQLPSPVIKLEILDDLCIMGLSDGLLIVGSLKTLKIVARIKAHLNCISSLNVWEKRVFSTSTDGSIRFINLETRFTKSLRMPENEIQEITCADHDEEGVLYAGTVLGFIYKINMMALTIITPFLQLGAFRIDSIKIMKWEDRFRRNMLIHSQNKITIRDCNSGDVIMSINLPDANLHFYYPNQDVVLVVSGKMVYRAKTSATTNGEMQVISLPGFASTATLFDGDKLIIAFQNGSVELYDTNLEHRGSLRGMPYDTVGAMASWGNYVVSYFIQKNRVGLCKIESS